MTWTWTNPTFSIGWLVALIVALVAAILGFMGQLPKEVVLLILAITAIRL
jgi:hypothetical protein